MKTGVANKVNGIKEKIVNGFKSAVDYVKGLINQAKSWGMDLIQNIINGLHEEIQALADGVTDVANTIRDLNGDTLAVQPHQLANGNIDKLTIFAGKNTIRNRVRVIGTSDYYSWMENKKDTGGSADTFAGESGKAIDRVQIVVKS